MEFTPVHHTKTEMSLVKKSLFVERKALSYVGASVLKQFKQDIKNFNWTISF